MAKSRGLSTATILIMLVGGIGAVTAAMALADDTDELFGGGDANKVTQPLELRGRWLGMSLTSTESASARAKNIPPGVKGVMVLEIAEQTGWRARQGGVQAGDVITAVDGTAVRDMADFYDATRRTDVAQAVVLDVQRWGQPMSLVLPAVTPAAQWGGPNQPAGVAVPPPGVAGQPPGAAVLPPGGVQAGGVAPAAGPGSGAVFMCPLHRQGWSQQAVDPHYRCPMCNRQLVQQVP